MSAIDNIHAIRKLDPANMRDYLRAWPEQLRLGWQEASTVRLPEDYAQVQRVVILGMGGSAMGGDMVWRLVAGECKVPFFILRDYDLPAFVDSDTLVIASSYSGNTEEVLAALSQASQLGARRLAISSGGKLAEVASREAIPFFQFTYQAPPRAGLGYALAALLGLLCQFGLVKDKSAEIEETAQVLEKLCWELNEDVPTNRNVAKALAKKLQGRLIIIYGAGLLSEVAFRWKTQFNENSKAWAFCEQFPELNHNAILGYQSPPEITRKVFVVLLRSHMLHPRHLLRQQVTGELLIQSGVAYEIVSSEGTSQLSQMSSSVIIGDYISYYLALLNKTDPSPVPAIDYLKRRLEDER
jgi:glucose/mannose-6-phosphate isomerase